MSDNIYADRQDENATYFWREQYDEKTGKVWFEVCNRQRLDENGQPRVHATKVMKRRESPVHGKVWASSLCDRLNS